MAAPSRTPIATRPLGPIQLLSNAYFKKKVTALIRATIPMRFSQRPPIRVSRSRAEEFLACELWSGGAAKTCTSLGRETTSRECGSSRGGVVGGVAGTEEGMGGSARGMTGVSGFGGAIAAWSRETAFLTVLRRLPHAA